MPESTSLEKVLYRVPEVAEMLSLGRSTVYELIETGQLRATRVGRAVRVSANAIAEWTANATDRE